jgi:hypothetical protein
MRAHTMPHLVLQCMYAGAPHPTDRTTFQPCLLQTDITLKSLEEGPWPQAPRPDPANPSSSAPAGYARPWTRSQAQAPGRSAAQGVGAQLGRQYSSYPEGAVQVGNILLGTGRCGDVRQGR